MYKYKTNGVCSKEIQFDVSENKVSNVCFKGGCIGSLRGISILIDGMDIDEVINKFKDVKCGKKSTSCPAQLAKALIEYKEKSKNK